MSNWFPVSASRLKDCHLITDDEVLRKGAILPFFNAFGVISIVLIVDNDSEELQIFRTGEVSLRVPLMRAVRITGPVEALSESNIDELAPLWHYDPWMSLKKGRFVDNDFAPVINSTNCVNRFLRPVAYTKEVWYQRRLQKLAFLSTGKDDSTSFKAFTAAMLPDIATRPPAKARPIDSAIRAGGWKLAPFWEE